jgi:hypothetical protein
MKLTWLLVPLTVAAISLADAQDSPLMKIGTITIPAARTAQKNGPLPPSERRSLQKPPLPQTPKTLAGESGPLPPSEQKPDRKVLHPASAPFPTTLDITATVSEAWWNEEVDNDRDGYKQSARLVWDPDVVGSAGSLDVYEKIYYKVSTSRIWALVTVTATHTITGTSGTDVFFLQINGAPHDLYDWRIDIYRIGHLTADNSRNPSLDPDLDHYALEYPEEDATATIYNAWWTNEIDCDGDGYKSSARLVWDPDVVGSSGSLTVHEAISRKYYADPNWSLYSQTLPHTITGNSPDDPSFIDFTPFYSKSALFDFKIDIYREGESNADATRDPSNDADLNDYGTEAGPLDGLRAGIADVWWSGNVDNDGDGYRQFAWLHWDPDVVGGASYLLVDCRVSYKLSESSQWQVKIDQFSTINGSTMADAESLKISQLPHGLYDWKIEAYSDWNAAPDFVRQPSNEPLLGSFAMELPEEDGTTAVGEPDLLMPRDCALLQNYPNPFNPKTTVKWQVAGVSETGAGGRGSGSNVKLVVYDLLGREVAVLVDEHKAPGTYVTPFDANGLASGVYIYRMTAGTFVASRQMLLLK